jgi:hypothetical protein
MMAMPAAQTHRWGRRISCSDFWILAGKKGPKQLQPALTAIGWLEMVTPSGPAVLQTDSIGRPASSNLEDAVNNQNCHSVSGCEAKYTTIRLHTR